MKTNLKKRLIAVLLCAAAAVSLCGCGSVFDKEYVVEAPYVPSTADPGAETGERINVRYFSQLRQTLLDLVSEGKSEGNLVFDPAYEGDVAEDMASACWQVRSQDALCAYCVKNIAYELSKIVTYYEAKVTVSYSDAVPAAEEIVRLPYSTGIDELIDSTLEDARDQLVVLIGRSTYTAEQMEDLVNDAYCRRPALAPKAPRVGVKMLSGTGMQRLYEINLDYGVTQEELNSARAELEALDPFAQLDPEGLDEPGRALAAIRYLTEHCELSDSPEDGNIYSALIRGRAGGEGMAFAYVELCRRLGLDCRMIYGQRNWADSCWNIVELDGAWYHVDPTVCIQSGYEQGFLLRDEDIWASHRWDTGAYPRCTGELKYEDLVQEEQGIPATLEIENNP